MTGSREMLDAETLAAVEKFGGFLRLCELGDLGMDAADEDPEYFTESIDSFFAELG